MAISDLSGRVAVVTGAASGIGRGIAESLVQEGAHVVIADIEIDKAMATAEKIGAHALHVDVTDPQSLDALAANVLERFGKVDLVCNNAGVGSQGRIEDITLADWRWMLGVNLFGVIHGTRSFLPHLIANPDGGHFLNTASIGGLATMPGLVPYSVSKFGVVALTEGLVQEMQEAGHKVGATILCPGPIRSNLDTSMRNRPTGLGETKFADIGLDDVADRFGGAVPWLDPADVGGVVIEAIKGGDLYVTTHPDFFEMIGDRHAVIARAFGA